MESLYHPAADPELHAPDFVEAVARFRSAVKEFTASVNKLDDSIAAAIKVFAKENPNVESSDAEAIEIPIPDGYHPLE
jgi:hypothetical protein